MTTAIAIQEGAFTAEAVEELRFRRELLLELRAIQQTILRRQNTPEVNACHWCAVPYQQHGFRWQRHVGLHQWAPPSDGLRKFRLIARRAERLRAS